MRITDALLGEHGVIHAVFDQIESALANARTLEEALALVRVIDRVLRSHAQLEDELLFPALDAALGPIGPMAVMRMEHQEIEEALDDAARAEDAEDAQVAIARALDVARPHFRKEELVLFGLAVEAVPAYELERLGALWGQRRRVELEGAVPDPKPSGLRRGPGVLTR